MGIHVADLTNPLLIYLVLHANLQQFTLLEQLKFLHRALGFPPLSTLYRAVAVGYLNSFPDFTKKNIKAINSRYYHLRLSRH